MEKILQLNIKGMHCVSCEILIADEIESLPGVQNVKISATEGVGTVKMNGSETTSQQILEAVERAGYKAEIVSEEEEDVVASTDVRIPD